MNPHRLAVAGLVVAALVAAGCLGSGGDEGDLRVTDIDGDWTDRGTLEVQVTVTNLGSAEASGTVVARAELDGGETYTDRREVTLPPGRSATVAVVFEPPVDAAGSGFSANAWME